jgi:hypothetical protein
VPVGTRLVRNIRCVTLVAGMIHREYLSKKLFNPSEI